MEKTQFPPTVQVQCLSWYIERMLSFSIPAAGAVSAAIWGTRAFCMQLYLPAGITSFTSWLELCVRGGYQMYVQKVWDGSTWTLKSTQASECSVATRTWLTIKYSCPYKLFYLFATIRLADLLSPQKTDLNQVDSSLGLYLISPPVLNPGPCSSATMR